MGKNSRSVFDQYSRQIYPSKPKEAAVVWRLPQETQPPPSSVDTLQFLL
jgi:hypothetical protein